jgi:hypothetical protein
MGILVGTNFLAGNPLRNPPNNSVAESFSKVLQRAREMDGIQIANPSWRSASARPEVSA